MKRFVALSVVGILACCVPVVMAADALPFSHKVEVYRSKEGDITVFTLRLEQPFVAGEFEKSTCLRLQPVDEQAYLVYPKETSFQQNHAEFYGRLRGTGKAKLRLSDERVTENADGSRQVQVRQGEIEVSIPAEPVGLKSVYLDWAGQQNLYFARLLRYYPEESFFQYCLLQSQARYGVTPPPIPKMAPDRTSLETDLYHVFSGSLTIQEALQREALSTGNRMGELKVHVSSLSAPALESLPYAELLERRRTRDKVEPKVHEMTRLVPEDQYFLQFNSMQSLGELTDLSSQWGDNLLRLMTVQAKDQRLEAKLEEQLCLRRGPLTRLFADAVISEIGLTGADPFLQEGADLTVILRVKQPEVFQKAADGWLAEARKNRPDLVDAEFNYRGHKVVTHYTGDRVVSSFVVRHQDYVVCSNSHRAIRRMIDAAVGTSPSLYKALDYRYASTILPPSDAAACGYFFVPEAMLRRLVGPAIKISEKRRLQCYNNLVMLNNASLFYRLEFGRSPQSLSDLIEGRFVDPAKIVCPHGGAYAFDAAHDSCTCSLHNRLKYLTPNIELAVLNVSTEEAAEYERYRQRYQDSWKGMFDPIAVRITVGPRLTLETCLLPFANGSLYNDLRGMVDKNPQPIGTARIAPSAVASLVMVPGRKNIAEHLKTIPGVTEVLQANPTLADLSWIGDRVGLHFCDGQSILEVDPVQFRALDVPFVGRASLPQQTLASALVMSVKMPVYAAIDVENRESAALLLNRLSQQIFLKQNRLGAISLNLDAYQLPEYKQHPIYVFSVQVYALKLRLHAALVGDQLVVATKPEILREVIDVSSAQEPQPPAAAHMLLRLNRRALSCAYDDVQLYWAEKARAACHRNISSIFNLYKLYGTPVADIPRLSETKYGVTHFCPDQGVYSYDADRNQVLCSVHGNREQSRQNPRPDRKPSFTQFVESFDELTASLRFQEDALIATIQIVRGEEKAKPAPATAPKPVPVTPAAPTTPAPSSR